MRSIRTGSSTARLATHGISTPVSVTTTGTHAHDDDVRSCVLFLGEVDWTAFGLWLTMLLQARGTDILRVKGFLERRR